MRGYEVEIIQHTCGSILPPTFTVARSNSAMIATGYYHNCSDTDSISFTWALGGQTVPLPTPDGYEGMEAYDINDAGQIAGTLHKFRYQHGPEAFRYSGGVVTPLGLLPGATDSDAYALNRFGVTVGFSYNQFTGSPHHGFVWDGEMRSLGPDLGTPKSVAYDINDRGQVTGVMWSSLLTDARAFIWDAGRVTELPAIPLPGGLTSEGRSINIQGNVAGVGRIPAIVGSGTDSWAYAYINGEAMALGVLPGSENSVANSINAHNQIVGNSGDGFIWDAGRMVSLTDLAIPPPGVNNFNIGAAYSIDDDGVIVGIAGITTGAAAVRLTPVWTKSSDFDRDGSVGGLDLHAMLAVWGKCKGSRSCAADLDCNGTVNGFDLGVLLAQWR